MQRRWREGVRLSLMLGDSDVGVGVAALSAFLQRVASGGVSVTLSDARKSSGTLGLPGSGGLATRLVGARSNEHGDRSGAPPTTA